MEENKEIMTNNEVNDGNYDEETEYTEEYETGSFGIGKVILGALIGVGAYKGVKFIKSKIDEKKQKKEKTITIVTDDDSDEDETEN